MDHLGSDQDPDNPHDTSGAPDHMQNRRPKQQTGNQSSGPARKTVPPHEGHGYASGSVGRNGAHSRPGNQNQYQHGNQPRNRNAPFPPPGVRPSQHSTRFPQPNQPIQPRCSQQNQQQLSFGNRRVCGTRHQQHWPNQHPNQSFAQENQRFAHSSHRYEAGQGYESRIFRGTSWRSPRSDQFVGGNRGRAVDTLGAYEGRSDDEERLKNTQQWIGVHQPKRESTESGWNMTTIANSLTPLQEETNKLPKAKPNAGLRQPNDASLHFGGPAPIVKHEPPESSYKFDDHAVLGSGRVPTPLSGTRTKRPYPDSESLVIRRKELKTKGSALPAEVNATTKRTNENVVQGLRSQILSKQQQAAQPPNPENQIQSDVAVVEEIQPVQLLQAEDTQLCVLPGPKLQRLATYFNPAFWRWLLRTKAATGVQITKNVDFAVNDQHFGPYVQEFLRSIGSRPIRSIGASNQVVYDSEPMRVLLFILNERVKETERLRLSGHIHNTEKRPLRRDEREMSDLIERMAAISCSTPLKLELIRNPLNKKDLAENLDRYYEEFQPDDPSGVRKTDTNDINVPYHEAKCYAQECGEVLTGYSAQNTWLVADGMGGSLGVTFCPSHTADLLSGDICPLCLNGSEYDNEHEFENTEDWKYCVKEDGRHFFHHSCLENHEELECPHCGNKDEKFITTWKSTPADWTSKRCFGVAGIENDIEKMFIAGKAHNIKNLLPESCHGGHKSFDQTVMIQPERCRKTYTIVEEVDESCVSGVLPGCNKKTTKGKRSTRSAAKVTPKTLQRRECEVWEKGVPFLSVSRFIQRDNAIIDGFRNEGKKASIFDFYSPALIDLCAENEGCICQEACIPGICPCMKWYTPHKRFTPDQRLVMQFDTRCELIRQCGEACTCFISSCCNRVTQMKSKISISTKKVNGKEVSSVTHRVHAGHFICRIAGKLAEVEPQPDKHLPEIFVMPKFGAWPSKYSLGITDVRGLAATFRRQEKGKLATVVPVMVMETPFSLEMSHPRQLGLPVVSFFAAYDLPAGTELRYQNDFRAVNVGASEKQIPIPSEKHVDQDKDYLYRPPEVKEREKTAGKPRSERQKKVPEQ